ncbi:MAG: hypothetical protein ACOC4Y_00405 [bacterium]
MNSNVRVQQLLFEGLNDPYITDFIGGTLYNGKRPARSEVGEDITLAPLPINDEFVQTATVNVNVFVKDQVEGVPDYGRADEIFQRIVERLDNYSINPYFETRIASSQLSDSEVKGYTLLNIRVICKILKE